MPKSARSRRTLAACAVLLGAAGCGGTERGSQPPARNLLLVTIDTLRADHLGLYGYDRPTSPRLDGFAAEAVVFDQAYAVASWTLPSVVSMMTSLHPSAHTCQGDRSALPASYETLAERLGSAGFRTGAVTSHSYLGQRYGIDQGFVDFDEELVQSNRRKSHEAITSGTVSDKGIAWLEERARGPEERWFLWLHYFDPHGRYKAHPGLTENFGTAAVDRYDGEIAFTDLHVGRLLDRLAELGLEDETIVVVIADHGEEFGDHGGDGHRLTLYQEVLRVPFMIRAPGIDPARVREAVSCVDLAPTVLDLLDVAPPPVIEGHSLVPLLRGEPGLDRPPVLAEMRNPNQADWDGLVDGRWKLLRDLAGERYLLFDLERDPGEQRDVLDRHPAVAARMREQMFTLIEDARRRSALFEGQEKLELSAEEIERLEQLGYGSD